MTSRSWPQTISSASGWAQAHGRPAPRAGASDVGDDGQKRAADRRQAADHARDVTAAAGLAPGVVLDLMGAGGGDAGGRRRPAALHGGQATVAEGLEPAAPPSAARWRPPHGPGCGSESCARASSSVSRSSSSSSPASGDARGMAAVRVTVRSGRRTAGAAPRGADRDARLAGQGAAGHGGGGQPLGLGGDAARRPQQLAAWRPSMSASRRRSASVATCPMRRAAQARL